MFQNYLNCLRLCITARLIVSADFPAATILQFTPHFTKGLQTSNPVTPQLITSKNKYWNFNQSSIPYAIWPQVRYRLTRPRRTSGRNPWAFGVADSHSNSTLLMPAFSLPTAPPRFTAKLHRHRNAPLPHSPSGRE